MERPIKRIRIILAVSLAAAGMEYVDYNVFAQDTTPYQSTTQSPKLYDPDASATLLGTIIGLETVKPAEESSPFLQVDVRIRQDDGTGQVLSQLGWAGKKVVRVHLGPQWFMEEQVHRLELQKGSDVEVKGSKNVIDGKEVFIAAEIKQPQKEERLRLRHKDGTPVWSGGERKG